MNTLKLAGLAALASSVAFATNITINDPFTDSGSFTTPYTVKPGVPEAGRVEAGATANNSWDLASFELSGGSLTMSGGFNFATGWGTGVGGNPFPIGDIFVYSGVPYSGTSPFAGKDNWTHVIHFQRGTIAPGASSNPVINGSVINYQIIANGSQNGYIYTQNPQALITNLPWMVGDLPSTQTGPALWTPGVYASSGAAHTTTVNSTTFQNSITVDVSSILTSDQYFSVTMRCGNDILWGRVPDGGFTLVLLSLGLGALAFVARRRK